MKTINLSSCGQEITLRSKDIGFLEKIFKSDFIQKYIPSPGISENSPPTSPRINIENSEEFSFKENFPEFNYKGNNFKDILFVSEYLLERARQEKGMYSIHSSCAEKDGKAVLLFGWKDTGKTSTALHLARENGFKFSSEGRTVIDEDYIVKGRIHHLEEDNDFLKDKYNFQESCLDISKLCETSSDPAKLKLLVYPQITEGTLIIREWDKDKANYHMYELFSDVIRGVAKNINNYQQPLQSIDTPDLSARRSYFVNNLVKGNKVIQIRGSLEDICKTIDSMI